MVEKRRRKANDVDPLLKVTDVQERLGLSRSAVFSLVSKGSLVRVKLGARTTRFRSSDVEDLIARGRGR